MAQVERATPLSPQRLADAERRAELQATVSRVLGEAETFDEAMIALLPAVALPLAWSYAGVWCVEGDELHCGHTWAEAAPGAKQFAAASEAMSLPRGRGLPGQCWAAGQPVWLSAVHRDPSLPRAAVAKAAGLLGGLAFPVTNQRGVVGVIEGFTRDVESVTPELLRLADAIGRQVGQFLYRRSTEEELQRNEARYRAIIHGALDAIIAIDPEGHITEFNAAAERLFGYSRAQVLGRDMAELIIPEALRTAHRQGIARLRQAGGESRVLERRLELAALRHDGSEFPVELTISRIAADREGGFIGFLRDITERQRHAQEKDALLLREQRALQDASAANRLKDEFLAALSHELRTPLNAVLGWAQMLERGTLSPAKVEQALAAIRRNAEVQLQLVNDMLDLSAFIAGRVQLAMNPVPLHHPIYAAVETLRPAITTKRHTIDVSVPPVTILGDETRLQQVFWNLLGNAVKFTPPGGNISVMATVEHEIVVVTVRDTGVGIDPQFLPFVFDRFRQEVSGSHGGLGLGLAIVRQTVEALGGTVSARSAGGGKGSELVVQLPVVASL